MSLDPDQTGRGLRQIASPKRIDDVGDGGQMRLLDPKVRGLGYLLPVPQLRASARAMCERR